MSSRDPLKFDEKIKGELSIQNPAFSKVYVESEFNKNIGIGLLPGTSNSELDEYLEYAHSVLLLGVNPGFSNQSQAIDLPRKVNDFNTSFPNYSGEVIVDGGVKNEDLEVFEKIGVDVVVQGGAIFG